MWNVRLGRWIALTSALTGCVVDSTMRPSPVPSAEKLRAADCAPALFTYRQLLRLPPRVGMVVTARGAPVRSEDEQARAAQLFVIQCQTALVDKVRRAIVRCWSDAPDTETFQSCNLRF